MPTPTYATTVNGKTAVVLRDNAGDISYIDWDTLPAGQQSDLIDNLFDRVNDVTAITPATGAGPFPGSQLVRLDAGTVGATATGLDPTTTYSFSITIDGVVLSGSFLGSAASIYTDLLTELNTIIGAAGTATLLIAGPYVDNIRFVSATTGPASTVSYTPAAADPVYRSANYGSARRIINGGADLLDVCNLSFRTPNSSWQEQFVVQSFGPSALPPKGVLKADLLAGSPSPVGRDADWVYVPDQAPPTYVFSDGINWIDVKTGAALV